jgi:hypothetical protein
VELRRALGQECGDSFLHISGSGHLREPFGLQLHLLGEGSVGRGVKESFDSSVSLRGTLSQFRNERLSMSHELVIRYYPRDETDRFGLARV